ncbi:hypothetical protein TUN199_08282 [Pyrenophora tritici-repentis]|nr:hypothetical protein TUN199_08282 [Pyrenophora tritici-repentis]
MAYMRIRFPSANPTANLAYAGEIFSCELNPAKQRGLLWFSKYLEPPGSVN